jgi:alkanesulfonate monooxygenase SsuD/methylene tetrahydromethanopterin reductase-like flavin-dependent oxidoreductase (luciferase family)
MARLYGPTPVLSTAAPPLRLGIELPVDEIKQRDGSPRWAGMLAMARRAEELGFASLWVEDHLFFNYGERGTFGAWDGWSLLAALAAATTRIEIGALVACTSFRNPALLANMAVTLDEISGGRCILGLGAGWHAPEYRAFGFPFDQRVSRFAEALQIIDGLLHNGRIDFSGRFYTVRECELRLLGPRPHGPPIMVGSTGPRMLALTARYADAWNAAWFNRAADLQPTLTALAAACHTAGRDPDTLVRTAGVMIDLQGDDATPVRDWHARVRARARPLTGSPAEIAEELRAFAEAGISHVQVWLRPNTLAGIERLAPVLELLR